MNIKSKILCWLCLANAGTISAQLNHQDSIWLKNILSGKEEIRLNEETLKAIESGSLISTDRMQPANQMIESPTRLPVSKDFSEYLTPLKKEKEIDPLSVTPAVFMLTGLNIPLPKVYKAFNMPDKIRREAARPSGVSFNDALRALFSKSERARARNSRNANAWKYY